MAADSPELSDQLGVSTRILLPQASLFSLGLPGVYPTFYPKYYLPILALTGLTFSRIMSRETSYSLWPPLVRGLASWPIVAPIFCLSICCPSAARTLQIEGHLEVSDMINGTKRLSYAEEFRVEIDRLTNSWRIDDLSHPPKAAFTFRDYVLDRENANPDILVPIVAASPFVDEAYPIDLDQDQRSIWIVYCAANFLHNRENQHVILPDQDARSEIRIYGCRARIAWRQAQDLAPEKIDFIFSKDLIDKASDNLSWQVPGKSLELRAQTLRDYLSWVTNGMLRARLEVSAWTNVMGIGVPLDWKISYYGRDEELVRIFEAETTTAKSGDAVTDILAIK